MSSSDSKAIDIHHEEVLEIAKENDGSDEFKVKQTRRNMANLLEGLMANAISTEAYDHEKSEISLKRAAIEDGAFELAEEFINTVNIRNFPVDPNTHEDLDHLMGILRNTPRENYKLEELNKGGSGQFKANDSGTFSHIGLAM